MSRFEIQEFRNRLTLLRAEFPELIEDDETWLLAIESETDLDNIIEGLLEAMLWAGELVDGIKERQRQLAERKGRLEHRADRCRSLIDDLMAEAGIQKLELPEATISRRKVPPAVVVTDEEQVPRIYGTEVWKLDKKKLKEALQEGFEVPGAYLSNGGETISIRRS